MNRTLRLLLAFTILMGAGLQPLKARAQSTAFAYQGRLNVTGVPASGNYDFRFRLAADALAVSYVASDFVTNGVSVVNGLFATTIDFGSGAFNAANRWLEIGVRTNGTLPYTTLAPLQSITPYPYALYAANAGTAASISGTLPPTGLAGPYAGPLFLTNGANQLAGNGANLTALNASNLTSGIVPLGRLSGISSNQLDPGTWRFLMTLAITSASSNATTGISGMTLIPTSSFTMGDGIDNESDATPFVTSVSAFYIDTNLVTLSQWQLIYAFATGTTQGYSFVNSGLGKALTHPVQSVDWYDAVKWCNARSQLAGKTPVYYTDAAFTQVYKTGETNPYVKWNARGYRLPTEAEWELAARGGLAGQRFPWGNTISGSQANYLGATGSNPYDLGPTGYNPAFVVGGEPFTSVVGTFAANGYGIYDMAGNVWQWCWDWYGTPYAGNLDPRGPANGTTRIRRGGSWGNYAVSCRLVTRGNGAPSLNSNNSGFRCVLPPGP